MIESIVLRNQNLYNIPQHVFSNSEIKYLDLSNNNITILPPEISKLNNLEFLYLNNNQLKNLPLELFGLKSLKVLEIRNNNIKELPDLFSSFENIETFNCQSNPIQAVPNSLFQMFKLKNLIISNLNLYSISPKIGLLNNLIYLDLKGNKLQKVPSSIGNLNKLKYLELNDNKLIELPSSIGNLKNLSKLNLINNLFTEIPTSIGFLENIENIFIDFSERMICPPLNIIEQGYNNILSHLRAFDKNKTVEYLYEAKLIFVGDGEVGKTSVIKRILYNDFNETHKTQGIEINKWIFKLENNKDFEVNIWDFGGQEIFHATHKFFLTERSLYVLVLDARKDDELIAFDYWLNIINLLGNNSPIIIVLNKIDENYKTINETYIKNKFDNVKVFIKTSAKTGEGIQELINIIKEQIIKLNHIGDPLPMSYYNIKKYLEISNDYYITYDKFLTICKENNLNEEDANKLSKYLHDLGIIEHFRNNSILKNTIFIKPDWLTKAVYKLTDSIDLQKKFGEFTFDQLSIYWKDYPNRYYFLLLELMNKFDLCFQTNEKDKYIIAELLSSEGPKIKWEDKDNLKLIFSYDFMPPGVLPRLIVRNSDLIYENKFWKNGVILYLNETYAYLISNSIERKIEINLWGNNIRDFLSILEREISKINSSWNKLIVKQLIPCPCSLCQKPNSESHFFDFKKIRSIRRERDNVQCQNSFQDIPISEIIKDFKPPVKENNSNHTKINIMNIKKIEAKTIEHMNVIDQVENLNQPINRLKITLNNISEVFQKLEDQEIDDLKQIYKNIDESETKDFTKLTKFIENHIVPIGYSASGSALFEILRYAFS
ncbi:MAG: COR domain-containing protein [Deltaproteobacteria bacterium]